MCSCEERQAKGTMASDFLHSERFRARAEELMMRHHCPGVAVAIVHNGVPSSIAFGQASVDPPSPCTAETIFDIASSSKALTAASIALMVHDSNHPEVKWEANMSHLLPEDFVLSDHEHTDQVRLDDLIGHTSGMPGYAGMCWRIVLLTQP
jgi:CubicO group peptidase (beta-lactamase class C family)